VAAWIFQGNPSKFDIDDYLARYPELIYWFTPKLTSEIELGDQAYIWRAGPDGGVVAMGAVVEAPISGSRVKHPEALGADLWRSEEPDPDAVRTGIRLNEVRLSQAEGMVGRGRVKANPALLGATIITMPNATVFRLSASQADALRQLWGEASDPLLIPSTGVSAEGARRLVSHFRRERSANLRKRKVDDVRAQLGECVCALCGLAESSRYPPTLAARVFEVHHLAPLARATSPVCTTLSDLTLLCANCHRAVHASNDVEGNYDTLAKNFRKEC
jgi:EVE domain/HNH endonuclease